MADDRDQDELIQNWKAAVARADYFFRSWNAARDYAEQMRQQAFPVKISKPTPEALASLEAFCRSEEERVRSARAETARVEVAVTASIIDPAICSHGTLPGWWCPDCKRIV